jgi:DNA-binding response OmpR family regulator
MHRKLLIIEDDPKLAELVRLYLERDGYLVTITHDGRSGLDLARRLQPHLILLDLMLPHLTGTDLCKLLRAESNVPIIMLTAKSTEDDKLSGLDLGADDYITKPFSPREVVARVRAVLRRAATTNPNLQTAFTIGELYIDLNAHQASRGGLPLRLTPKEFNLLALMAAQPGKAFTRLELLEEVFGLDYEGMERTVDVHMMNLRKKIEVDPTQPRYLETVYGVGYKIKG